jgi:hydrogenase large subunit
VSRLLVGPFNRVEGDLEVRLETADGVVTEAYANSPLYRGFESILVGRPALDSLVIAPRICGICSVSQSVAAASALRDAAGVSPPPNGALAANVAHAAENAADHLTHFYLFFMPDFARETYVGEPWFEDTVARFKATAGTGAADWLAQRKRLLHVMGILAGKWPHSIAFQPGGTTKSVDKGEKVRLLSIVLDFRRYLETVVFGGPLESVLELPSVAALIAWAGPRENTDLGRFLKVSQACGLDRLGRTELSLMSQGAYELDGKPLFQAGVVDPAVGTRSALDAGAIAEDLARSRMRGDVAHPSAAEAQVDADKDGAYTWCKAPRLGGEPMEVGALARQAVDGLPLASDLVSGGANVRARIVARMVETARLVLAMEDWVRALKPGEPFCADTKMPDGCQGAGLVEAARGSLGHWFTLEKGAIARYQIIAPTTWNFSPRDSAGVPGPLEQALVGAPVRDGETEPVAVQHVVRSFDPCMVCTVH